MSIRLRGPRRSPAAALAPDVPAADAGHGALAGVFALGAFGVAGAAAVFVDPDVPAEDAAGAVVGAHGGGEVVSGWEVGC